MRYSGFQFDRTLRKTAVNDNTGSGLPDLQGDTYVYNKRTLYILATTLSALPSLSLTIMATPHAFVTAQFTPYLASLRTSPFGRQIVEKSLRTRPFIALRINWMPNIWVAPGSLNLSIYRHRRLFMVSREKPRAPFSDYYFPLTPGDEKPPLNLNAPLPFIGPLYLHTFALKESADSFAAEPIESSRYQLDAPSLERFVSWFHDARSPPALTSARRSGGPEPVEPDWDSFSDGGRWEHRGPRSTYDFQISSFQSELLTQLPSVWDELLFFDQLVEDYSWFGVTAAIGWLEKLRSVPVIYKAFHPSAPVDPGNLPVLSDSDSVILHSMKIPIDGEPRPTEAQYDEDEDEDDPWGEETAIDSLDCAAIPGTVVPTTPPQLIVVDICSILFVSL